MSTPTNSTDPLPTTTPTTTSTTLTTPTTTTETTETTKTTETTTTTTTGTTTTTTTSTTETSTDKAKDENEKDKGKKGLTGEKLEAAILRQIEYYFSDSNFRRDKFLKLEASKHPDGFVSISVLTTFNKLKQLSQDVSFIAKVLSKSDNLELSDDQQQVRRKYPLPEDDTSASRTVVAKGFSEGVTSEEVSELFEKFGKVLSARLMTSLDTATSKKVFKGTVLVEMSTDEEAKAALAVATLTHADKPIQLTPFSKKEPKEKKRKADSKEKEGKGDQKKSPYVLGTVVKFSGVGSTAEAPVKRTTIKTIFEKFGAVKFVDYNEGETSGYVRFIQAPSATQALQAIQNTESPLKIPETNTQPITASLLDGQEETEYWETRVLKGDKPGGGKPGGPKKNKYKGPNKKRKYQK